MIVIEVQRLSQLRRFFNSLPLEIDKEITKGGAEFMARVQKSAKLGAPRTPGGGELARSIIVRKVGRRIVLSATAPYAYFQEFGYRPHWIHSGMSNRMGRLIGSIYGKRGFLFVSKYKPFLFPALEINLARLITIMSQRAHQATLKARR